MVLDGHPSGTGRHPLRLVEGQKEAVARWMLARLPEVSELPGGFEAFGVERDGALIAGLLYTNYIPCDGGGNVHMWAVGEPGWMSRRVIAAMLAYPFVQLDCHRMTVTIPRNNRKSRSISEKLGFRLEGVIREGLGPRKDLMVYGLLRNECRWTLEP